MHTWQREAMTLLGPFVFRCVADRGVRLTAGRQCGRTDMKSISVSREQPIVSCVEVYRAASGPLRLSDESGVVSINHPHLTAVCVNRVACGKQAKYVGPPARCSDIFRDLRRILRPDCGWPLHHQINFVQAKIISSISQQEQANGVSKRSTQLLDLKSHQSS